MQVAVEFLCKIALGSPHGAQYEVGRRLESFVASYLRYLDHVPLLSRRMYPFAAATQRPPKKSSDPPSRIRQLPPPKRNSL